MDDCMGKERRLQAQGFAIVTESVSGALIFLFAWAWRVLSIPMCANGNGKCWIS